jgi:hypothetical protein
MKKGGYETNTCYGDWPRAGPTASPPLISYYCSLSPDLQHGNLLALAVFGVGTCTFRKFYRIFLML